MKECGLRVIFFGFDNSGDLSGSGTRKVGLFLAIHHSVAKIGKSLII